MVEAGAGGECRVVGRVVRGLFKLSTPAETRRR